MGAAIGFASLVIVARIFLPEVLNALTELFLIIIDQVASQIR